MKMSFTHNKIGIYIITSDTGPAIKPASGFTQLAVIAVPTGVSPLNLDNWLDYSYHAMSVE